MSIENTERDIEIRRVSFGKGDDNKVDVPVVKRDNGSARPRYMLAEVGVHDFIDVIGSPQYYYGTEMEYARREDTAIDVANAIGAGIVELGVVSKVPEEMHEHVGVRLNIPRPDGSEIIVLGQISSPLPERKNEV